MINKITFTGREEMLTAGLEKAAKKAMDKAHEYVGPGKVFENAPSTVQAIMAARTAEQRGLDSLYFSPCAQIQDRAMAIKKAFVDGDSFSYAISHGTPTDVAKEGGSKLTAIV